MNPKNKPILLFQRIIPSYRVGVFKKLQKELGIIPCYSKQRGGHSLKSELEVSDLLVELLPSMYFSRSVTFMLQSILKPLFKYKPDIVISEGSSSYITLWLLYILKPFFGYKIITWSHGVKNREIFRPFSSRSSKVGLRLLKMADACLLYSEKRKNIILDYITENDKLFVAPNTLDISRLTSFRKSYEKQGVSNIKRELNWESNYNLIYIGRLIKSKKVDYLIEVIKHIPDSIDVSLQIIGDGSELNSLKKQCENDSRIYFHGEISDDELSGKMLYASDFMLIPGYVGLAVVHSFAFGCPVITSKIDPVSGPFHSPEFEYIIDSKNGFILDHKIEKYTDQIMKVLNNEEQLESMSIHAKTTVESEAGIDLFVSGFRNAVNYVR